MASTALRPAWPPASYREAAPTGRGILDAVALALTAAAVAALFLISSDVLTRWGFSYATPDGSPLGKFHPATWLAFAALALTAFGSRHPIRYFDTMLARCGGVALFAATLALVMAYTVVVRHVPFTPLVDTFATPIALFFLLLDLTPVARTNFARLVHLVLFANACLATYEFATGWRLTPIVAEGVIVADWRSSALLGHPLANAALVGTYILVLVSGRCLGMPPVLRPFALLVQMIAMIAFGGRTAIVLLLGALAVVGTAATWRLLRGRRVPIVQFATIALTLPIAAACIAGLADAGFFDKFADRFVDDNGSTLARIGIVHVLAAIPLQDLLLGVDLQRISTLQRLEGLEFGIESFWINFAVLYGLGVSLIFFVGFFFFLRDLLRETGGRALLPILLFLGTATTGVSLSAKTTVLGTVVALLLVLLRGDPPLGTAVPVRPDRM